MRTIPSKKRKFTRRKPRQISEERMKKEIENARRTANVFGWLFAAAIVAIIFMGIALGDESRRQGRAVDAALSALEARIFETGGDASPDRLTERDIRRVRMKEASFRRHIEKHEELIAQKAIEELKDQVVGACGRDITKMLLKTDSGSSRGPATKPWREVEWYGNKYILPEWEDELLVQQVTACKIQFENLGISSKRIDKLLPSSG